MFPLGPSHKFPVSSGHYRLGKLIGFALAVLLGSAIVSLFILSFFLDGIIRPRLETKMNRSLKGYQVTLKHAHLQLIGLTLTLKHLVIRQNAHPEPPIAAIPVMVFRIYWGALIDGHIVGTVDIGRPRVRINEPQLVTEATNKIPVRREGWQDALQNVYPFKLDRITITDGDVVYIDKPGEKPLHVQHLNCVSENIRNIRNPNQTYPSPIHAEMVLFGTGRLRLDGRANYLMTPYPGLLVHYSLQNAPLSFVTTASQYVNLNLNGGTLSSHGDVEYSPKITRVDITEATIDSLKAVYIHTPQSQVKEKQRAEKAGQAAEKENNRPGAEFDIRELRIRNSRLAFDDKTTQPPYTLDLTGMNLSITNLSNHQSNGLSHLDLTGDFMGSGRTHVFGTFLAGGSGPQFNARIESVGTDLTALNPVIRAYGKFDVAQGRLSVYSQIAVKNKNISGYVKPLFSDVRVYQAGKDRNKSIAAKAKEAVIGAATHLFKNRETKNVATQIDLSGRLSNPNVSTWQAFAEVLRNAFVKAILPGLDREVHPEAPGT